MSQYVMNIFDNAKVKRFRVIDLLRKNYLGLWYYDPHGHVWYHESGKYVRRCAVLAPRYEGDDDTFATEYWMYDSKPGVVPERVWLFL